MSMTLTRALRLLASIYVLDRQDGGFDVQVVDDPWAAARVDLRDFREAWAVLLEHAAFGAGDGKIPGMLVRDCVTRFYDLVFTELASDVRTQDICRPRQVAMFICVNYCGISTVETGALFNRDHSTVINAVRAVKKRKGEDPAFATELATIIRQCQEEHDEATFRIRLVRQGDQGGEVAAGTQGEARAAELSSGPVASMVRGEREKPAAVAGVPAHRATAHRSTTG